MELIAEANQAASLNRIDNLLGEEILKLFLFKVDLHRMKVVCQ